MRLFSKRSESYELRRVSPFTIILRFSSSASPVLRKTRKSEYGLDVLRGLQTRSLSVAAIALTASLALALWMRKIPNSSPSVGAPRQGRHDQEWFFRQRVTVALRNLTCSPLSARL